MRTLVDAPVLPYPNPCLPYLLETDAIAEGVGAVLSQVKDGQERVVAYFSTKFSKLERNYCMTKREPNVMCQRLQVLRGAGVAIIHWLKAGEGRPCWEQVSPETSATKCLMDQWEELRSEEGVLQRHWVDTGRSENSWVVVLPHARPEELLRETHEGNTSGHSGVERTLNRLRQRVYWTDLRGATDSSGHFTKWPEACALPKHEAETMAEFLVSQVFTRFGVPDELQSGQRREFESRVFKECCRVHGVKKTRTTPLHPLCDRTVERYNATPVSQLAR
ncbi:uncharacterized protein LOC135109477 [Scylla paramamosain]|uniref:uncharacterized protein LOC135109477 n=1 Tax=Scylla paramamosain TaxID=85552 RepID=UPI003082D089